MTLPMGRIPFIDIILLSLRKHVVSFGKHVVFRCNTIIHQQDQHDGEDHWGALAGVAAKETVLAHFQYTSDFPVASDRSVMGNEPKPPNRPMSMSNVSVTVTSSLS